MSAVTPGLVCGHHHLYSALARGMPAPPVQPTGFLQILEQVWWRLDVALDEEMIRWSATLGAMEALMCGTTAIVDHHESPSCIEGSLSVIADACAEVGVRTNLAYGVTDRHGADGARRGLAENERFLRAGGRGMVGVHASLTCTDDTLAAAAGLAADLGVGVHIHVAEGREDATAGARLEGLARDDWWLVHCVYLDRDLPGTIAHNPRSNMNNSVDYARPAARSNPVALGTDGIGADMLEEARLAYVRLREDDVLASPDTVWGWLDHGYTLFPEAREDRVTWNYDHADSPWHVAFTPGVRALDVVSGDGEVLLRDGLPTRVDLAEVRAKAAEQAARLHARL
ncbi:MAG: amidohydrolase family protein [Acidimicrobiaceae bacterium]|nr:amidohydrolase family protein [Ilumatobacter sp.]MCB9379155.1 amidohydrolase family protein [Acidimicrobiaceae bacterium]MCO5330554.1 amidohydrolase family protein [Ilumatobacteraceae bacterium]